VSDPQPDPSGRRRRFLPRLREVFPRARRQGKGALLFAVSTAGAEMARRPDRVPAITARTATELGCDGVSFRVLDDRQLTHRSLESAGLAEDPIDASSLSAGMADLVLQRGETVVARSTPEAGEASLPQPSGDFVAAIASPIWIEGWIAAVLVGAVRADARLTPHTVAAFGLLASQAGLTLDNAQRIEEERQTAGRLEQGDRLKTEFLTTISHEMRTPLTVLMGNGLTLEQSWTELGEESRLELLAGMNTNVRILDGMLTNLLDYARLEAGELWVSFEPFDISAMLRAVCERTEGTIGDRQLRTEVQDDLLASGDTVLIRRIVSHLLANAAAHTPPGTTITASCHRRDGEVVVEIVDDGPGIGEEDLPFLGERFFRAGDVNARPKGLGLGLALALGILDLHGSTLVVENVADGGARFSFSLPWVPDPSRSSSEDDASGPSAYAPHHGRA
jgi:two-component system sensor histidine kinase KdpD